MERHYKAMSPQRFATGVRPKSSSFKTAPSFCWTPALFSARCVCIWAAHWRTACASGIAELLLLVCGGPAAWWINDPGTHVLLDPRCPCWLIAERWKQQPAAWGPAAAPTSLHSGWFDMFLSLIQPDPEHKEVCRCLHTMVVFGLGTDRRPSGRAIPVPSGSGSFLYGSLSL